MLTYIKLIVDEDSARFNHFGQCQHLRLQYQWAKHTNTDLNNEHIWITLSFRGDE